MYEDIGTLIGEGFAIWKRNLNLCVPFLLASFLSLLAMAPLFAMMYIAFGSTPKIGSISSPEEIIAIIGPNLPVIFTGLVISAILIILINSFFSVGGIAMAEQALTSGSSSIAVMWLEGKRRLWDMFFASILAGIVMLAGSIFVIPGILSIPIGEWNNLTNHPDSIGLLAFGSIIFTLYLFIISLVLAAVPYAVVVDVKGPIGAIKESIRFFSYNKFDVFIVWIIVAAISLGLQMTVNSLAAIGAEASQAALSAIVSIVNVAIIAPLSAIWWTRLYMSRTGKKLYQESALNEFDERK
jgi:hypothetical protein